MFSEINKNINHYFVVKGCLGLFFIDNNASQQTLQFAIENWWITDYSSFTNQSNSGFFLQAIQDTVVLEISYKNQELLLEEFPILERYFRVIYQRAYAASQFKFKFQSEFSKAEYYQHFASNFPDFINRIPQSYLASYLNMTPEYFSKIKKSLDLR
ncbi:Crp/Fnr family transcriptional regulator [Myroides sp. LJL119]